MFKIKKIVIFKLNTNFIIINKKFKNNSKFKKSILIKFKNHINIFN